MLSGTAFAHASHDHTTNFEKVSKRRPASRLVKRKKCNPKIDPNCKTTKTKVVEPTPKRFTLSAGLAITNTFYDPNIVLDAAAPSMGLQIFSGEHAGGHGGSEGGGTSDGGEGGEAGNSFAPTFDISLGMLIINPLVFTVTESYTYGSGFNDPTFVLSADISLAHHRSLPVSFGMSAPLSTVSQNNYKITTATATGGIRESGHVWSKGVTFLVAYTWYSKTIFYKDDTAEPGLSGLIPAKFDAVSTEAKPSSNVGNREFSRYGVNGDLLYNFSRDWQFGWAASLTLITHQFTPVSWVSDVTLGKVVNRYNEFSGHLGIAISREALSIPLPNRFRATAGIKYEI